MKAEKKKTANQSDPLVRSVSMSSGYDLARALSTEDYNPTLVDEWYKSQRKSSQKYAKAVLAG